MKIISHRGNLYGPDKKKENHPDYIKKALNNGYDVEIDVWNIKNKIYLGHDSPQYNVTLRWLKKISNFVWCHAKNTEALSLLIQQKIHCFWHENDKFTLTSKGIPWCYPNNHIKTGITVIIEPLIPKVKIFGVCTDYPAIIENKLSRFSNRNNIDIN